MQKLYRAIYNRAIYSPIKKFNDFFKKILLFIDIVGAGGNNWVVMVIKWERFHAFTNR